MAILDALLRSVFARPQAPQQPKIVKMSSKTMKKSKNREQKYVFENFENFDFFDPDNIFPRSGADFGVSLRQLRPKKGFSLQS